MTIKRYLQLALKTQQIPNQKLILAESLLTHNLEDIRFFAKIVLEKNDNPIFKDVDISIYENTDFHTKLHLYSFIFSSQYIWADLPAFKYIILISDNLHSLIAPTNLYCDGYMIEEIISIDITGFDDAYHKIQKGISNFKEFLMPIHNFKKTENK